MTSAIGCVVSCVTGVKSRTVSYGIFVSSAGLMTIGPVDPTSSV